MEFEVRVSELAFDDIAESFEFIAQESVTDAQTWYEGLQSAIEKLRYFPTRYPLIRESETLGIELRAHRYFNHRIVIAIDEKTRLVNVVRIWHGARQDLSEEDL